MGQATGIEGPAAVTPRRSTGRRVAASVLLIGYLAFAAWTFFLNDNVLEAQLWFVPISLIVWIVLRIIRPRVMPSAGEERHAGPQ